MKLSNFFDETRYQLLFGALADVRRSHRVNLPVITFSVGDQSTNACYGMIDMLGKLVTEKLADFSTGFAHKIVSGSTDGSDVG